MGPVNEIVNEALQKPKAPGHFRGFSSLVKELLIELQSGVVEVSVTSSGRKKRTYLPIFHARRYHVRYSIASRQTCAR